MVPARSRQIPEVQVNWTVAEKEINIFSVWPHNQLFLILQYDLILHKHEPSQILGFSRFLRNLSKISCSEK